MKLPSWFRKLLKQDPPPAVVSKGKMICIDCGRQVHKRERYTIVAVKHRSCTDTKLVGQQSFPAKGVSE